MTINFRRWKNSIMYVIGFKQNIVSFNNGKNFYAKTLQQKSLV